MRDGLQNLIQLVDQKFEAKKKVDLTNAWCSVLRKTAIILFLFAHFLLICLKKKKIRGLFSAHLSKSQLKQTFRGAVFCSNSICYCLFVFFLLFFSVLFFQTGNFHTKNKSRGKRFFFVHTPKKILKQKKLLQKNAIVRSQNTEISK